MPEIIIDGIPVNFPFEPYDLQKAYMSKVIQCLEMRTNGVLESPTGTGKTLSLLCSSLGWLTQKRKQAEIEWNQQQKKKTATNDADLHMLDVFNTQKFSCKIIYCSRTHSQITQAMQELKRTSYKNIKAAVIGSRDQLCIHQDVMKETTNSNKIHMCKVKITTRSCYYYNRVEKFKDDPQLRNTPVSDIEDLVRFGRHVKCCPFFISKQLVDDADIIFMPYNYLLDPLTRKANNINLNDNVVILDEAHNVEKVCEESASAQFSSSDIAVCIDDLTQVMKGMESGQAIDNGDSEKDFTIDDLALLKEMVLQLEKAIDGIEVKNSINGITFPGSYIFELLQKADIHTNNSTIVTKLLDNIIQFLAMTSDRDAAFRPGRGIQKLFDLVSIIFSDSTENFQSKVGRCYKVHVEMEPAKAKNAPSTKDGWIQTKATSSTAKIINYWCFNPGFGMQNLLGKNVRSIILTSGTLAPLKPLISELGIPINVRLENPHIIKGNQICVKVISHGPDKEPLVCNYQNRDNPKYLLSLGRTILSLCPVIPHGLLVFFTSYTILNKCRDTWQANGIWSQINNIKPVYIEPKGKEAFVDTMAQYYGSIKDPSKNGAIFMAVCRGKVSEGLDFADINGRAVIITGLPFPPYLDPRVVLKKKYLEENRSVDNQMLSGDEWYFLEATRAVNQAIGRVIRHRNDYGAILLCDSRFSQPRQQSQLSSWIQGHLKQQSRNAPFGAMFGEITRFFRNAEKTLPKPAIREINVPNDLSDFTEIKKDANEPSTSKTSTMTSSHTNRNVSNVNSNVENSNAVFSFSDLSMYKKDDSRKPTLKSQNTGFLNRLSTSTSTIDFNNVDDESDSISSQSPSSSLVTIHKREKRSNDQESPMPSRKRKFFMVSNDNPVVEHTKLSNTTNGIPEDRKDVLKLLKSCLSPDSYAIFLKSLIAYQKDEIIEELLYQFRKIFKEPCFHYLFKGMRRFIKDADKSIFDKEIENIK